MPTSQLFGPILILRIVVGLATIIAIFSWRRNVYWRFVAIAGAGLVAISQVKNLHYLSQNYSDLGFFWQAGDALRHGRDPYTESPVLNTPNSLALFELFSMVPLPIMANLWKLFNLVGCLFLIPLSARFLRLASGKQEAIFPFGQILVLSILLGFSNASMENINGGQLHVLVALAILVTLILREVRHPALAGLIASLAFFKINTAVPMMPLFVTKKSDIKLVIVVGLSGLAQTAIATWPDKLPWLVAGVLRNIAALSTPGGGNDYAYTGPACAGIVSFNHWLYRLGVTDRSLVGIIQLVASFGLGGWLTWMCWSGRMSRKKSACVFCLYAMTFLYHRIYDVVLLALPLAYALDEFQRKGRGMDRRLVFLAGLAIVGVHYVPDSILYSLSQNAATLSWPVRAFVLPLPFWLILLAMGLLLIVREEPEFQPATGSPSTQGHAS